MTNPRPEEKERTLKDAAQEFAQSVKKVAGIEAEKRGPEPRRGAKLAGYIVAIVLNAGFIYVFNNLLNWDVRFFTPSLAAVAWSVNLALGAALVLNLCYIFYNRGWFRHGGMMLTNVLSFISMLLFWIIFPFDLPGETWVTTARTVIIVAMVGTGIGFVTEMIQLILRKD
jgi:hypothetical protein